MIAFATHVRTLLNCIKVNGEKTGMLGFIFLSRVKAFFSEIIIVSIESNIS